MTAVMMELDERMTWSMAWREVEDAFGLEGGGFVHTAATARQVAVPTFGAGLFELGALGGETDLGEPEEDDAENWARVFLGLEAGIGAELVGAIPEALFERREDLTR